MKIICPFCGKKLDVVQRFGGKIDDGKMVKCPTCKMEFAFGDAKVAMEPKEKDRYRSVNEMLEDLEKIEQPEVIVVVDESEDERYEYEGHEYVDLGLPSGLKWATCNIGANKPEDYGNYYAWGETKTKDKYTVFNYEHIIIKRRIFGSTRIEYASIGNDISGNSQYDAARANWGGTWRLPTKAELEELKNKCTWKWTTQNGVKGYKITGPNGNSIFLPAAGYRFGSPLCGAGGYGLYWSSTPNESLSNSAYSSGCDLANFRHPSTYGLFFYRSGQFVNWDSCIYGRSVRPVAE